MDLKQTLKTVKLYESTISMVLGAIVIALAAFLVFSYFRNLKIGKTTDSGLNNSSVQKQTYTVQKGDTLWSIAQAQYQDGYSWTKIAEANSINESDQIEVGTELTIPDMKVADNQVTQETKEEAVTVENSNPTTEVSNPVTTDTISSSSYTVAKGDSLWKIAVRAYGDGYKWSEIAKANKLINPNVLFVGTNLTLPR